MTASATLFLESLDGVQRRALLDLAAQGPVHRIVLPSSAQQFWLVTGHAEARAALTDTRLRRGSNNMPYANQLAEEVMALSGHMLNSNPPDHTRLRRLVSSAFSRRRIDGLGPRIEELCAKLIEPVHARLAGGGVVDLMTEFAFPLPFEVICDLVGLTESNRHTLRSDYLVLSGGSLTPLAEFADAARSMLRLLRAVIEEKRSDPDDDLLSQLAAVGDAEDRLTVNELTSTVHLLLFAGHETTTGMIGNAMLALMRHPDQLAALRSGSVSMSDAVEELLRYDNSVRTTLPAEATTSFRIGDAEIQAGDRVVVSTLAAGLDPSVNENPDALNIHRPGGAHFAFGHGIHHCLGAPLARLELRLALSALLTRLPDLELADEAGLTRMSAIVFNRLTTLPVRARRSAA